MMTKTCNTCHNELNLDKFSKHGRNKDGLSNQCKTCYIEYKKQYRLKAQTTIKKPKPGQSLLEKYPEVAKQWSLQNKAASDEVSYGSEFKAWWECDKGHTWQASISSRTATRPTGCPQCFLHIDESKTVKTLHPTWMEWVDVDEQKLLSQVTEHSSQKLTWTCPTCAYSFERSIKNFTGTCPQCFMTEKSLAKLNPILLSEWDYDKNTESPELISYNSAKNVWWKCSQEHSWETPVYQRVNQNSSCPRCCIGKNTSSGEKELLTWLNNVAKELTIIENTRKVISPYELDIYIPEKNIAIEYNGLYWHTEDKGKDKKYHHDKWASCKKQGIQLIQVWEDDWRDKQEIVKASIIHKLGLSSQEKIFARKTTIKEVDNTDAKAFLDAHHIQGYATGSIRLGLYDKQDSLIALMVFRKEGLTLNLVRYATAYNVVGGFSKILRYAEKNYEATQVISFSDHMISNGNLYENNGFTFEYQVKPDYQYLVKGKREHKFNYRLGRFKKDDNLIYIEGKSETELAILNNIPRVWDAGKTKWVKEIKD